MYKWPVTGSPWSKGVVYVEPLRFFPWLTGYQAFLRGMAAVSGTCRACLLLHVAPLSRQSIPELWSVVGNQQTTEAIDVTRLFLFTKLHLHGFHVRWWDKTERRRPMIFGVKTTSILLSCKSVRQPYAPEAIISGWCAVKFAEWAARRQHQKIQNKRKPSEQLVGVTMWGVQCDSSKLGLVWMGSVLWLLTC